MAAGKKDVKGKKGTGSKRYSVAGDKLQHNNKHCPKCGVGYALANHKDRLSCGKCHYMERK